MPRVQIHAYDIDTIEALEAQEEWEELVSAKVSDERRPVGEQRGRERRFGGSESQLRKREERRKQYQRRRG